MAQHTVIKVVSWEFRTAFSLFPRGKISELEYSKWDYTKPGLGGIFAFDTIENAIHFAERFERKLHREIHIYEALTSRILPTPELVSSAYDEKSICKYHAGDTSIEMIPPPRGTVICADLLLLTNLKEYENRYPKARPT